MLLNQTKVRISIIELEEKSFHPFVTVYIDSVKARFLIDTGASRSVIDTFFYQKIAAKKMKKIAQKTTGLYGSESHSHLAKIKELRVADLKIKNYLVTALDLSHVNKSYKDIGKSAIQGILGGDLLMKHQAEIHYGKKQLVLQLF